MSAVGGAESQAVGEKEAKALAKEVDLMIVVGSKTSANTSHLAEILSEITTTIHIETEKEIGVQVNGKLRGSIDIKPDEDKDSILNKALNKAKEYHGNNNNLPCSNMDFGTADEINTILTAKAKNYKFEKISRLLFLIEIVPFYLLVI